MDGLIFDEDFANDVTRLVYEHFRKLPKTGKPQKNKEWTLLAAIVMSSQYSPGNKRVLKVVALATGTKCLGHSLLNKNGDMVHDSHAEVLTRRAFVRFLFHQLSLVYNGCKSEVFTSNDSVYCTVKPGVKFHLFISHTPCGDASIFSKTNAVLNSNCNADQKREADSDSLQQNKRLKSTFDDDSTHTSACGRGFSEHADGTGGQTCTMKTSYTSCRKLFDNCQNSGNLSDIYRTGAKCVKDGVQDPKGEGENFHCTGSLRTKPGRGDPTWSMSCSDKIALWNVCGLQGALISIFINTPIYVCSIVIGKCPFNNDAFLRAVVGRTTDVDKLPKKYCCSTPLIFHTDIQFEFCREKLEDLGTKVVPCPAAIIWSDVPKLPLDIGVNGKKQGITKKSLSKRSSWLSVCKRNLLEEFLLILEALPKTKDSEILKEKLKACSTYLDYKNSAHSYQETKQAFFQVFKGWMKKPKSLQMFSPY